MCDMKKFAIVVTGITLLIFGLIATPAIATNPEPCVPTEAQWTNEVWHTWTGGPVPEGVTPAANSEHWNATSGNPQSANHAFENHTPNVPYFVSHGGSGNGDWFLWTATWVDATECPDPEPSPDPTPTLECPDGQVPGAPNDENEFVCQNDNPTPGPEPESPEAPKPSPAVATPTFTG